MASEVVTCSKVVTLHSLDSRQPVHSYTPHRGNVNGVSINHTGKVIASCGQDGKVFLVTADKPENKLLENNFYPNPKEKPSPLSTCAFSPSSKYLAVGSQDSTVKVWDLRGQSNPQKEQNYSQIKAHMCGITSLAWIKNFRGENIGTDFLASSSSSGQIMIHSHKSGLFKDEMTLKLQDGINCIKVSESMDSYCRMAACTNAGTLAVWDLMNGKDKPVWTTSSITQNKSPMTSLSISTYSPVLLVTSSVDQTLTFFDIQEKKSVKKITAEEPLSCVGLHANGHTLVAGGMYGGCFVYDLRNPAKPQNKLAGHEAAIKSLEFFKNKEKEHAVVSSGEIKGRGPSVSNQNSSSTVIPHTVQVEPKPQNSSHSFPGQPETKSKQNIKLPQTKTNNFVGAGTISQKSTVTQQLRDKKVEQKLSTTAQQIMRNNQVGKQEFMSEYSQSGVEPYRYRPKQVSKHESFTPIKHEYAEPSQTREEVKQLSQKLTSVKQQLKTMKEEMGQMEQRITMSMTRQFQLQYGQFKKLLQEVIVRDKEKDEYIKKLEGENGRLKHSTF